MEETATTRTAKRWERFVKFVEKETTIVGVLLLLFSVAVIWIFLFESLNLDRIFGDYALIVFVAGILVGYLVIAFTLATFWFLGSLFYLVENRIVELRRRELRILYEMNTRTLQSGVELKGKWKDVYDLIDLSETKVFEDVERTFNPQNRETVEYPITKWRITENHKPPHWNLIEIPTDNQLIGRGLACAVALVLVIGILMSIPDFINQ